MKNKALEFWRFIFAIVICLYHYRAQISKTFLPSGYLAVEFFFIISGYLLAKSVLSSIQSMDTNHSSPEIDTLRFFWKKIKRLWPHYTLSLCISIMISVLFLKRYSFIHVLRFGVPEFFMLQMSGLSNVDFTGNAADWYVSSLILASFICYYLCRKNFKLFCYIASPVIALSCYTYLYHTFGHLGSVRSYRLNMYSGTIRAFAGICLGCMCFALVKFINKNFKITKKGAFIFSIVDLFCIALIIFRFSDEWKTSKDFLMLPIFLLLIINIFIDGRGSIVQKILDAPYSMKLGKISYAIFLNHTIIRDVFKRIEISHEVKTILYLSIVIIVSILTTYIIDKFNKSNILFSSMLGLERKTSNNKLGA